MEKVENFRYLGRTLTDQEEDRMELHKNLRKSKMKWENLIVILTRDGEWPLIMGNVYKDFIQSVMI